MGLRFYLKGTSLDAHFSYSGKTASPFGNVVDDPAVVVNANAGVFGSSVISFIAASVTKGLIFPGILNVGALSNSGAMAMRMRIVPSTTVSPFAGIAVQVGNPNGSHGRAWRAGITSGGKPYVQIFDLAGNTTTHIGTFTINATANVPFDFMVSWDGTTTAGGIKFSVDGAEVETITAGISHASGRIVKSCVGLVIGSVTGGPTTHRCSINDLAIWDTAESHTYTVRTDFDAVSAFDGTLATDPGIANVRSGTGYTIAGAALTGTAAIPTEANVRSGTATDATTGTLAVPAAANVLDGVAVDAGTGTYVGPSTGNVKTGVAYGAGSALTGTYDGSDRWTDPGEANVRQGTAYKANSTSNNKTGDLDLPALDDVRDGVDFDSATKTGTLDLPAESDVRDGTNFDGATQTGTLDLPSEADVVAGVDFDNGTKTGTLEISPSAIAAAVWDALSEDHTVAGSFGVLMKKFLTLGKYLGLMK